MLEQRPLLRFLFSQIAGQDAPEGKTFFDKVKHSSDDEIWSFLKTGMAKSAQTERHLNTSTARRYGSAGLYVIPGGRR